MPLKRRHVRALRVMTVTPSQQGVNGGGVVEPRHPPPPLPLLLRCPPSVVTPRSTALVPRVSVSRSSLFGPQQHGGGGGGG